MRTELSWINPTRRKTEPQTLMQAHFPPHWVLYIPSGMGSKGLVNMQLELTCPESPKRRGLYSKKKKKVKGGCEIVSYFQHFRPYLPNSPREENNNSANSMKWHRRLKPPTPQAKCIKLRQRVRKVRMGETQMPPQNLEVKKLL